ncbi:hypothetical protein JCM19238_5244 [Vibrio ponticus]|nr:hypothetical protein JCM19238_5244 [Vibrio ponticus]
MVFTKQIHVLVQKEEKIAKQSGDFMKGARGKTRETLIQKR